MNTSRTLFIADDDKDDLLVFSLAVEEVDPATRLITASDGVEAMKILKHPQSGIPDYIFLDLNMPKKSGIECIAEIRRESRLNGIPIIIYSTSSAPAEKKEALASGADIFITKFIRFNDLCEALTNIFNNELSVK